MSSQSYLWHQIWSHDLFLKNRKPAKQNNPIKQLFKIVLSRHLMIHELIIYTHFSMDSEIIKYFQTQKHASGIYRMISEPIFKGTLKYRDMKCNTKNALFFRTSKIMIILLMKLWCIKTYCIKHHSLKVKWNIYLEDLVARDSIDSYYYKFNRQL